MLTAKSTTGLIPKISLVCLVTLMACCVAKEPIVQSQNNSNINPNQNSNSQNSSDANHAENRTIDYFAHIKTEHREVLQEWLKSKTYLRPAVEEIDNSMFQEKYKDSFKENMEMLRGSVGEGNYQYYSIGDMSHDRKADFAVLLVDSREQKGDLDHFALAIFNAPFKKGQKPAYYEENLSGITNSYIAFGAFDNPYLFLGKFESDVYCATYYPKGKGYYFKDCME